jgi:hypothetical protein
MYMSDLDPEDGGETVFPKAYPTNVPDSERISQKDALEQLRASPHGNVLERGSWEEQLVCFHCGFSLVQCCFLLPLI